MIAAIKAEFRKLYTVRSTYLIIAFTLLIVVFFAFYIEGVKAGETAQAPTKLAGEVMGAIGVVSVFGALISLLLFSHEYRYNLIAHTLTTVNGRSKLLLAKILVVSGFAIVFSVFIGFFSPFMTYLGVQAGGHTLGPQTLDYVGLFWRTVFIGWGYAMLGLMFAVLIRSQVGAIATLFLLPATIEPLLGLLLKQKVVYLPINSLMQVTNLSSASPPGGLAGTYLSPGKAALIFCIYLAVGWIVAWALFLRRDAN